MTGSGSAVFGIFRDEETALKALSELEEKWPGSILRKTSATEFGLEELPV